MVVSQVLSAVSLAAPPPLQLSVPSPQRVVPDSDVVGSTMTRKLALFSHIPKSAGTFLNNVATVNDDAAITFSKKSRP